MLSNENIVNFKVLDLFEYYNFCLGHFSIQGCLENLNFHNFYYSASICMGASRSNRPYKSAAPINGLVGATHLETICRDAFWLSRPYKKKEALLQIFFVVVNGSGWGDQGAGYIAWTFFSPGWWQD